LTQPAVILDSTFALGDVYGLTVSKRWRFKPYVEYRPLRRVLLLPQLRAILLQLLQAIFFCGHVLVMLLFGNAPTLQVYSAQMFMGIFKEPAFLVALCST